MNKFLVWLEAHPVVNLVCILFLIGLAGYIADPTSAPAVL